MNFVWAFYSLSKISSPSARCCVPRASARVCHRLCSNSSSRRKSTRGRCSSEDCPLTSLRVGRRGDQISGMLVQSNAENFHNTRELALLQVRVTDHHLIIYLEEKNEDEIPFGCKNTLHRSWRLRNCFLSLCVLYYWLFRRDLLDFPSVRQCGGRLAETSGECESQQRAARWRHHESAHGWRGAQNWLVFDGVGCNLRNSWYTHIGWLFPKLPV